MCSLDNNKNRIKENKKSNAEMRKMFPQGGGDIGIKNGVKIDANDIKFSKRPNLSNKK